MSMTQARIHNYIESCSKPPALYRRLTAHFNIWIHVWDLVKTRRRARASVCFYGFLYFALVFPFYLLHLVACSFLLPHIRFSAVLSAFCLFLLHVFCLFLLLLLLFCFSAFCFCASLLCCSVFLLVGFTFLLPPSSFKSRPAPFFSCPPFWFYSAPKN